MDAYFGLNKNLLLLIYFIGVAVALLWGAGLLFRAKRDPKDILDVLLVAAFWPVALIFRASYIVTGWIKPKNH